MAEKRRTVVITGGGTGIGLACAHAFASQGDQVFILGRRLDVLERAVAKQGKGNLIPIRADVSSRVEIEAALEEICSHTDAIDVLVNNAGFVEATLTTMPLEELEVAWDAVINTNLKGAFLMACATASYLVKPGGRIINVSSIAALTGGSRPGAIAYAAAKSGLHGMTFSLARELSVEGITVNVIAPGFIAETEFTGAWPRERVEQIVSQTPAGRPGQALDIAEAILFLASSDASFITGEVMNVNGGWAFGR